MHELWFNRQPDDPGAVPTVKGQTTMDLGRYSKLIGALLGNAVAIFLSWLAVQFPALAQCTIGPDGTDACTVFNFTQAQITGFLMAAFNMYFVYQFPANRPPA